MWHDKNTVNTYYHTPYQCHLTSLILSVNEKVLLFIQKIKSITSNFIPRANLVVDGTDPSWVNKNVTEFIKNKKAYNNYDERK